MTSRNAHPTPSLRDLLPRLLPIAFAALKASIAERGYVGEPTIADQHGEIVDGFHRERACDELGIFCPREVREFTSEDEKYELALRLNCQRRQLSRKQKRALIDVYRWLEGAARTGAESMETDCGVLQKWHFEAGAMVRCESHQREAKGLA